MSRTITAIFNPTVKEVESFFNQDISDKIKNVRHERILCASMAINKNLNQVHYSLSLTTNNSEVRQNTQIIEWIEVRI